MRKRGLDNPSDFDLTTIPYINRQYKKFYEKHGYLPEFFQAYNCAEVVDCASTLATSCGNATKLGATLILEENE